MRGAVPGDLVRARITRSKRSFGEADAIELVDPSPDRVEPLAPHPGAPWQVLPYERQAAGEGGAGTGTSYRDIGRFESPPVESIVPAVEQLHYRNKLEYSFGEDDETGKLALGFHRPRGFDLIDDVEHDITLASARVDESAQRSSRRGVGTMASARGTGGRSRASCATSSCARDAAPASSRRAS